ncbi:hypothetical protein QJS10_CPA03g01539 [Acorus calamus]|uniref:Uncharacterized protein n=1 Tax=Acorus calamus TaxID=4465 RepID=A0AAV9F618_ACOCL|nr:hypothetical protein QJS10_CPA03g01539 [Acorus calamus]
MDLVEPDDNETPLLVSAVAEAPPEKKRFHACDVHVLSLAFLFIFSAYNAVQNVKRTINTGTYRTLAAVSHAKDCNQHEGTIFGNFNGEFWGLFVIGNLISFALLKAGKLAFLSINCREEEIYPAQPYYFLSSMVVLSMAAYCYASYPKEITKERLL